VNVPEYENRKIFSLHCNPIVGAIHIIIELVSVWIKIFNSEGMII